MIKAERARELLDEEFNKRIDFVMDQISSDINRAARNSADHVRMTLRSLDEVAAVTEALEEAGYDVEEIEDAEFPERELLVSW